MLLGHRLFLSPRLSMPSDPLVSTGWQMVAGGAAMLAGALASGEAGDLHLASASTKSLLAFAYLVLAGSLVAFTAYAWLLQNVPISKVRRPTRTSTRWSPSCWAGRS